MRFMMMVKATPESEAGAPPKPEEMQAMGELMEDMAKAGILLGGEGLTPSSKGRRLTIAGGKVVSVVDGPFAETKELVAGWAIAQCASWDELAPWIDRFAAAIGDGESEIRPIAEAEDFITEGWTEEDAARENALRQQVQQQQQ